MTVSAPVKVLANAAELIELLAWEGPQTPADIAVRIGVPRSSVYRLIEGLAAISLIEPLPDARVRLTSRWLHLADSARASMVEWEGAVDVLEQLVENTGQTAFLTVRREASAVCIDWRQGRGIGVFALKPGRSLPLYAGAAGRTLLAYGPSGEVLNAGPHTPFTPHTLVTRDALEADIALTLEQGFVLSDEDVTLGISAIGVPLLRTDGTLGCVSLGGISADIRDRKDSLVESLRAAVQTLR